MSRKRIIEIIAGIFIFLLVYTATDKIINRQDFHYSLKQTPFIRDFVWLLTPLVPVTELIVSTLLFIPITRLIGLYASAILMLLFSLYVAWMLVFVPKLPCNCGGVISSLTWNQHLWLNVSLTLTAMGGIRLHYNLHGKKNELVLRY